MTDCELLSIDKGKPPSATKYRTPHNTPIENFLDITVRRNINEKLAPLQRIPLFYQTNFNMEKALPFFKLLTYEKDEVILQQGTP